MWDAFWTRSAQKLQRLSRSKYHARSISVVVWSKNCFNPIILVIKTRQKKVLPRSDQWPRICAILSQGELNQQQIFDFPNFECSQICEIWLPDIETFFLPGFYTQVNQFSRNLLLSVSNSRSRCHFAPRWFEKHCVFVAPGYTCITLVTRPKTPKLRLSCPNWSNLAFILSPDDPVQRKTSHSGTSNIPRKNLALQLLSWSGSESVSGKSQPLNTLY